MTTLQEVQARVAELLEDAERAAGTYADDPSGWHARHRFEMERVKIMLKDGFGASFSDQWDGARVRIAGVRSSSTSGVAGALRNWLIASRKRIEQEASR